MSIRITEDCIACGFCQEECKNGAIRETDTFYAIDANRCTECVGWFESPRCMDVCWTSACVPDPDHEESHEQLLAKWQKLHPRKTPQVT